MLPEQLPQLSRLVRLQIAMAAAMCREAGRKGHARTELDPVPFVRRQPVSGVVVSVIDGEVGLLRIVNL